MIGIEEGEEYGDTDARSFEILLASKLEKHGKVHTQVKVSDRGDGRRGKIDLVLETEGQLIPIEIDRLSPRRKSVFKVQLFNEDSAFVITRSPFKIHAFGKK